jgi:tetratricopeptide (TPR) repeat protein
MKFISRIWPPGVFGWLLLFIVEGILIAGLFVLWQQVIKPQPPIGPVLLNIADVPVSVVDGRPAQELYRLRYQGHQSGGWMGDQYRVAARYSERIGQPDQSLTYLEAAFSVSPQDAIIAVDLAERYIEYQDWPRAVEILQQAAVLSPDDGWIKTQLGLILAPQDAITALEFFNTASSWVGYDATITALLPTLQTSTDDAGSAIQIGLILGQSGLWSYAQNAFEHAYEQEAQAEYAAYIGLAREMQGKSGQHWIEQAVVQSPDSALVQYVQGIYQRGQRDYQASVESFTAALALDPLNPAYYAEIGQTYRETGDVVSAEYWLRQAVTVSNQDPQFEQILTDFYAVSGASLSAAGISTDEADPNATEEALSADAQAEIGWTLYRIGRVADAETAFGVALALEPDNIRVLYYQARIALERGDRQTAQQLLDIVIARNTEFVAESQALLDLLVEPTP